jgi:hypothetical protein
LDSVGIKNIEILEYQTDDNTNISKIYNQGLEESNYDIVCIVNTNLKFQKNWGKSLLNDFNKNPDYAIIGKVGSCELPENGIYWTNADKKMVGQIHYQNDNEKWLNRYSQKFSFLIP